MNNNNNTTARTPALVRLLNLARDRRPRPPLQVVEQQPDAGVLLNDLIPTMGARPRPSINAHAPTSASTTSTTTHLNVSCDECGEMPIIGTRYKSTVQPNYDVCRHCLEENHTDVKDEFTALTTYGVATTEPATGRSVAVHSLYDLQELIQDDPTVEDLAFYVGTLTSPALGQTVRKVLRDHPAIKSVHIHIFGTENATETILALAEGLQENKSVLSVSWNILSNRGQRGLSPKANIALHNLMIHNQTIKYMFFQRQRGFGYVSSPEEENGGVNNKYSLANQVFDALAKTHLHTVRFAGHAPVSNENKKKAWAAMVANPHLKRVKATFQQPDYQLDLLQADKKHQWMQRWTHENKNEERWTVLKEVLEEEEFEDKVPVLYHFLRNQPECLLQWSTDRTGSEGSRNSNKMVYDDEAWV